MSIPQLDPQVEQDAVQAIGVIVKSPKARGVVADVMCLYSAGLSVVTTGIGALVATGYAHVIPAWAYPALVVAAAVYVPVSSITHGIWKANVR